MISRIRTIVNAVELHVLNLGDGEVIKVIKLTDESSRSLRDRRPRQPSSLLS